MKQTQADRILALLKSRPEVSAWDLVQVSVQYSARISELRRAGHKITNRVETIRGVRHGYFRLERDKVSNRLPSSPAALKPPSTLFSAAQLSGCVREWRLPD